MHLGRCLAPVTLVALGGIAHADCPTNLRDLPPTGFIASAVRDVTGTGETARPRFEAKLGVAGGMRAEGGDGMDEANVDGSDVLDVREGSAHITASVASRCRLARGGASARRARGSRTAAR